MAMHVGDHVRLRVAAPSAPEGTEGHVFGIYRRGGRVEVVVALNGRVIIVDERELDLLDARPASDPPD